MASLQKRGDSWRCLFMYKKALHAFTIGKVEEIEAKAVAAKVDYLLMRLKQNLLDVPAGCDIVTFVKHDGHPPADRPEAEKKPLTLSSLLSIYLSTHSNGTLEERTLSDTRQHFKHWYATLGEAYEIEGLNLPELQRHVNRRTGPPETVSAATAKKEVASLRTVGNWALGFGLLEGSFPYRGLRYPKVDEKPPFMTWPEVERQVAAGGDPKVLWDCLFLTAAGLAATVGLRPSSPPVPITKSEATDHFKRTLRGSKWEVVKGWQVLRHNFISNCVARRVDQRYMDRWCGHTTNIRDRYIHLIPSDEQQAIRSVFG